MPKEKASLDTSTRLANALEKQNNYWYRFGLGVISGLGTAVGATIVFALVAFLLVHILRSIGWEEKMKEWGFSFDTAIEEKLDAEIESRLQR